MLVTVLVTVVATVLVDLGLFERAWEGLGGLGEGFAYWLNLESIAKLPSGQTVASSAASASLDCPTPPMAPPSPRPSILRGDERRHGISSPDARPFLAVMSSASSLLQITAGRSTGPRSADSAHFASRAAQRHSKGLPIHKGLPRACRHTRRAYQGLARYPWRYTQRGSPNAEGLPFILSGQVCAGGPDSAADGAPCLMKISINPYAHPHRGHLALGHATPHAEPTLAAFISKPAMPPLLQKNCAARLHQLIASPNETVLSIWCRSLLDAACHFFAALPKPSRVVSTSRRSSLSPAHVTRLPA